MQIQLKLMIALIQRVSEATVHVNGNIVGEISTGILAMLGVEKGDTEKQADRLLERMLAYRIFPDDQGRMNLDVRQAGGNLLLVSQFTLAAIPTRATGPVLPRLPRPTRARACLITSWKRRWTHAGHANGPIWRRYEGPAIERRTGYVLASGAANHLTQRHLAVVAFAIEFLQFPGQRISAQAK